MNYKEIESSREIGIDMLKGGTFLFVLFSSFLLYICNVNGTLEIIVESSYKMGKFWGAFALYSFFQLFIVLFCGLLFHRGIKEIRANADWVISVESGVIKFISPSAELQESYTLNLTDLVLIEKKVKDAGDSDEDITWAFISNTQPTLSLEYFGSMCLDSLSSYLHSVHKIEYNVINIDKFDKPI
ncbi:hypothetical protein L1286_00330 [Pseudoalteromonas sp. SMS1]|uniref:hypothetical protein n=1 Tax=Pseudoalteromonas sp. SMS1 TaxID=2908894 RepID=UPI001F320B06|nr:hypothetical protein [Pseudoalteromonas sp. SMS1]MCF2855901.1 hypothetical protein [Pseudoalteromonas sp. SMS1]